jgi:hypothetical protein
VTTSTAANALNPLAWAPSAHRTMTLSWKGIRSMTTVTPDALGQRPSV